MILQFREFPLHLWRRDVGSAREDLSELHERRSEIFERKSELTREQSGPVDILMAKPACCGVPTDRGAPMGDHRDDLSAPSKQRRCPHSSTVSGRGQVAGAIDRSSFELISPSDLIPCPRSRALKA